MRSLKMLSIALYRFDSKINLWGIKWLEAYPTGGRNSPDRLEAYPTGADHVAQSAQGDKVVVVQQRPYQHDPIGHNPIGDR